MDDEAVRPKSQIEPTVRYVSSKLSEENFLFGAGIHFINAIPNGILRNQGHVWPVFIRSRTSSENLVRTQERSGAR